MIFDCIVNDLSPQMNIMNNVIAILMQSYQLSNV